MCKNNESTNSIGQNVPDNTEAKYTFYISIKTTQEINRCIVDTILFPRTI